MKLNCWQYKDCGLEAGGSKCETMGVCPAAAETRLDNAHEGLNAGRACWVVPETLCAGKGRSIFSVKFIECKKCDFYKYVAQEEDKNLINPIELARRLE